MRAKWSGVNIYDVQLQHPDRLNIHVGDPLEISAQVYLGEVSPAHVRVQAYYGENRDNTIHSPAVFDLSLSAEQPNRESGNYLYHGRVPSTETGAFAFNVRVIPTHQNLNQDHELRLITWAK